MATVKTLYSRRGQNKKITEISKREGPPNSDKQANLYGFGFDLHAIFNTWPFCMSDKLRLRGKTNPKIKLSETKQTAIWNFRAIFGQKTEEEMC